MKIISFKGEELPRIYLVAKDMAADIVRLLVHMCDFTDDAYLVLV